MGQYHDLDDDDITGESETRKIPLEFRQKNGENGI